MNHFTLHIGQTEITAGVAVCHTLVIVTHQMQNRGMQVMRGNWVLNSFETEVIGCPVDRAFFYSTTGHPKRKAPVIVITALAGSGSVLAHFDRWSSPEFARTQDQSLIQQSALFQIDDQCGQSRIALAGQSAMFIFDVRMTVPRLHVTVPRLDESHATFDQSTCHQQLPILRPVAVKLLNMLGLL